MGRNDKEFMHGRVFRKGCFIPFLTIVLIFGISLVAYGSGGDIVWQYGDAQPGKQQSVASAVDSNGNVVITGYQNLAGGVNDDYYTVKFKADGSGVAWRASFDKSGGSDQATAVVIDANNDVIVTGFVWNGVNKDIHTIKYSGATGALLWQHTFNGAANGNDTGTAVAVDSLNNVFVAGNSQNAAGNDDIVILKYGPNGPNTDGTPIWQAIYNGTANGNDQATSVTAGIDGIAMTGESWNGTAFDLITLKFNYSGIKTWETRYTSPSGAQGKRVKMDAGGNVLITGYAANSSNKDMYTAKYSDATGAVVWQKIYNGGYDDEGNDLYVDVAGDAYVTGYTWTLTGKENFFTARYSAGNGNLVWQQTFDSGNNSDVATNIVVDEAGDVFVAGYTVTPANYDFQTIKYKRDSGNQLWQQSFNGAANKNDRPVGIGLAPTGQVLVAGWSDTSVNDLDYYVVKFDPGSLNPPTTLTATTLSNTGIQLAWADNSSNEDGFAIERKFGDLGTYVQIATVGANTTSYTDTGLIPNNYYYYRVKAYSAANGNSAYSNEAHALTVFVTFTSPTWSYLYNSPDNKDDFANAIAVGPDNNPVVTGYSLRTVGGFDYYTVKLNRTNSSVLWSDLYDDTDSESDMAKCVAVDSNNNAIVSGYSQLYYPPAQKNINSIYTIKYPAAGPPASWGAQYNGPGGIDDRAVSIATTTDAANNIVVVGYGKNAANNDDIYVVKYDANGNKVWAATPFDGGGDDFPSAVAVAPDGSVYVTGYSEKSAGTGIYNFFTAKYNGATGALIWMELYGGPTGGDNRGSAIAIDGNGDLYVTGSTTNAASSNSNKDIYTIKYSGTAATAQRLWESAFDGTASGDDAAIGVKVDPIDGAIVVAGTTLSSPGNNDITLLRYTPAGVLVWQQTLQRPANDDYATAMAIDSSGYIYIAGNTSNASNSLGATMDIISLIYNYDGTLLGATTFNGAANDNDEASSIAVNYQGEAFISGYSTNANGNADYLVVKQTNNYSVLVPAPFIATAQADYSKVNLNWGDNTAGTSFHIERTLGPSTPLSAWALINTTSAGTIAYQDNGLNPGTNYCYRIEAFIGSFSSRKIVTCTTTALAAPVMNPLNAFSSTATDIGWSNVAGNSGYKLERSTDNSTWAQLGGNLATDTILYHDIGLAAGTVYYYRVSTLNSAGASLVSNIQAMPVLNALSGTTTSGFTLTWPTINGNTGYILERSPDNTTWVQAGTPAQGVVTSSATGLASGTTYYYRLRVVTASGTSGASLAQVAITLLLTPTLSSATAASTTQINLVWTDPNGTPNGEETGFLIEYAPCTYDYPTSCTNAVATYWGSWSSTTAAADVTTLTVGGLISGRTYRFQVTATLGGANSISSSRQVATANLVGPADLTATPTSGTSVHLAWTDSLGETNYKVLQNGTVLSGVTLARNSNLYDVTGLTAGMTYTFQVQPYNATSLALSNQVSATPFAPPTLTTTAVTPSEIDLSWNEVGGETNYELWRAPLIDQDYPPSGWGANILLNSPAAGVTTYHDTGLANGYTYQYEVRYKLPSGAYSAYSNVLQATTIPSAPSGITAQGYPPNNQLYIWWSNVIGETGYNLQLKQRAGSNCTTEDWTGIASIAVLGNNSTAYFLDNPVSGSVYCFRVNAFNNAGASPWTTATTELPSPNLNPLTGVNEKQASLSWNNVTGNTGYMVEQSTDNSYWAQYGSTAANVATYTPTYLAPNQIYYFRVRTLNGSNNSYPSNVQSATTQQIPVPTLNSLSGITTSQITLTWATGYVGSGFKVERSLDNNTWALIIKPASNVTSYTNTGLTAGTLYYYRVSTKDSAGYYSSPSSVQSAVTTPAAPTLAVAGVSESRNDLTWQLMLGATDYKIYRSIGSGGSQMLLADPAKPYSALYCGTYPAPIIGCPTPVGLLFTYSDTGLTENTQYCYQLKASNPTGGDSAPSAIVCQKTPDVGGPALTSVTPLNSMKIQMTWSYDPSACTPVACSPPDGFEIWKQLSSGKWGQINTVPNNSTSYTDTMGIEPMKTYNYQVRAYQGTDKSAFSTMMGTTTPAYAAGDNTCNYIVTVATTGPGMVNVSPAGVSCGIACSAYCSGAQVTLTAVPDSAASFIGWSGNCSGILSSCVLTIDSGKSVTGTFQ